MSTRRELATIMGMPTEPPGPEVGVDVDSLKRTVIEALRASVFVKRKRAKRARVAAWGGPGVEVQLGRDSALEPERVEAMCALALHAAGSGHGPPLLRVSAALPLSLPDLVRAGVGEESVTHVSLKGGQLSARIERTYGGRVIGKREEAPQGALARAALLRLMLERRWLKGAIEAADAALSRWDLARRLSARKRLEVFEGSDEATPTLSDFLARRLDTLGVEDAADVALLSAEDFAVARLPQHVAKRLERDYPTEVLIGGSRFRLVYDLAKQTVCLELLRGDPKRPPHAALVPRLTGFKVEWLARGKRRLIRG